MLVNLAYALWFVAPMVQSLIAVRMWVRRLYRQYPFFLAYTLSHVITFPIVLYFYNLQSRDTYRSVYVAYEALDVLMKSGVIYELFADVFRRYEGIRGLGRLILRWGSVALILIASVVAAYTHGSDTDKFLAGLFNIEQSLEIVQGGFLVLLFAMSSALGLQWTHEVLGIAIGLGLVTGVHLAAFALRLQFGSATTDLLSLVGIAAYDCATAVWLATVWARREVHRFEQRIPHWDIEAWNRALLNLLRQ